MLAAPRLASLSYSCATAGSKNPSVADRSKTVAMVFTIAPSRRLILFSIFGTLLFDLVELTASRAGFTAPRSRGPACRRRTRCNRHRGRLGIGLAPDHSRGRFHDAGGHS